MQSLWRTSLVAALAAAILALLAPPAAFGQNKSETVTFKTADGVTLSGTFYPSGGKKDKKAVVLLLHNFDHKNGGGANKDGWPTLAKTLQEAGYAVLSFDFRGFGDSKDVNKEVFWDTRKFPYNTPLNIKRKGAKVPESIDHKDFKPGYYVYLVNDVAAAKAYLDRANDRKEVNSSSVIVMGAGQGATIGAMWVANECIRRKDKTKDNVFPSLANLADPECKDIAGCVWISATPRIESRSVTLSKWVGAAARTNKIPVAFYYGSRDTNGDRTADNVIKNMTKDAPVKKRPIEGSSLIGSKLLDGATNKMILKDLDGVIESRGPRELIEKKVEASAYYYMPTKTSRPVINKKAGEEVPPVNLSYLLQ